ncbi:MAG TPA: hypothetical protein VL086_09180 [Candidatus Nitrosotalea sp.]|nr:hypothetical protein [Candidatus Nitrosotalea sp.]
MIQRQSLEETISMLSLSGCATSAEEAEHDLDRLAAVLELRSADARRLGVEEPVLELVTSQLRTLARRLEATGDALYAHARLARPVS